MACGPLMGPTNGPFWTLMLTASLPVVLWSGTPTHPLMPSMGMLCPLQESQCHGSKGTLVAWRPYRVFCTIWAQWQCCSTQYSAFAALFLLVSAEFSIALCNQSAIIPDYFSLAPPNASTSGKPNMRQEGGKGVSWGIYSLALFLTISSQVLSLHDHLLPGSSILSLPLSPWA